MKYANVIFFLLFIVNNLLAQDLYFCKSYTEKGKPIDAVNQLNIKPWGSSIYILIENDGKPLGESLLYLYIDKLNDDKYSPYESRTLNITNDKTWAVASFEFKDPGKYEVYFLNSKEKRIATNKITVHASSESSSTAPTSYRYYENCKLSFCEAIIEGKPVNTFISVPLEKANKSIYIYLDNRKPLHTEKLIVQVWQKKNGEDNYNLFVESKYFNLDPTWNDVFFKYFLYSKGNYKFDVYNENEILVAKNFITITN